LTLFLVVLVPLHVRPELEPVDAERADAEVPAHESHRASRSLGRKVVDVDDGVPQLALLVAFVEPLQKCLAHSLTVSQNLLVARSPRRQLDDLHVARRLAVGVVVRLRLAELAQPGLRLPAEETHHIRKMPNVVSGIGAFNAAEIPSASTRRVSSGSM